MNLFFLFLSLIAGTFSADAADKLEQRAARSAPKDRVLETEIVPREIEPLPVKNTTPPAPKTAKGYVVFDLGSAMELEPSKELDTRVQIASITKLMTAAVALDKLSAEQTVTVPAMNLLADESRMGLTTGEKIKVKELIRGALIPSGSDAARTLASSIEGGESAFVEAMNKKALDLGMKNTKFANPVGLDNENNFSTPQDLAILTRYVLRNPLIRESVSMRSYTAVSDDGRTHRMSTTNQLLGNPSVSGVKTGRTSGAGECLITLATVNGHQVITVILGSSSRFAETSSLLSSLKASYTWEK